MLSTLAHDTVTPMNSSTNIHSPHPITPNVPADRSYYAVEIGTWQDDNRICIFHDTPHEARKWLQDAIDRIDYETGIDYDAYVASYAEHDDPNARPYSYEAWMRSHTIDRNRMP